MTRVRSLAVWLAGTRVGVLESPRIGAVRFTYDDHVRDEHTVGTPLLSCSLPVRSGAQDAWAFATGLLPEGQHRLAMASRAGVTTLDVLGMLDRFGRDVAGAVVIARDEPGEREPSVEPLSEDELITAVEDLAEHPLGLYDDSELSIAGLQDKCLLVKRADGQWGRPVHGYPSTHILKVDDRLRPGVVQGEHTCLQLAAAAGLPAARSELMVLGELQCLVVERFDRRDGARLHQEDTCQALGIDPEANERRAKYEDFGGPTLRQVAGLLERWGSRSEVLALLDQVVFTVVIADADAHGKNIALLHPSPERITLAPLYDTVPTSLWPRLRAQAAMRVDGRSELADLTVDNLVAEARAWGIGGTVGRARVAATAAVLADAVDDVVPISEVGEQALAVARARAIALVRAGT